MDIFMVVLLIICWGFTILGQYLTIKRLERRVKYWQNMADSLMPPSFSASPSPAYEEEENRSTIEY